MKKIRNKFLVYILLPALGIMFVGTVCAGLMAQRVTRKLMNRIATLSLRRAADEVDVDLGRAIKGLRVMALQEGTISMTDSDRRRLLKEIGRGQPSEAIFVAFPDNRLISDSEIYETVERKPTLEPWYKQAVNSAGVALCPPRISKFSGNLVITMALKIVDRSGNVKGVVGYHLPMKFITDKASRIEAVAQYKDARFAVIGKDGVYAIHTQKEKLGTSLADAKDALHQEMFRVLKQNQETWAAMGDAEGRFWFAGYQKSRFAEVFVTVEIPLPSAMMPILLLTGVQILLLLFSLIGLTAILIVMARKIGKPIELLSDAAVRLKEGDYSEKLPVVSKDELGRLMVAFNTMMDGLRQRDHIRNTFGRYLTEEVVNRLLESEDGLALGGETREISILISDVRGFTPLTADMPPEKVIVLLNRYLGLMLEIIMKHGGVIDEIMGDGILAFFGAPEPMPDHAERAAACALEMQAAMGRLNESNTADGLPILEMGIGLNTGNVVVGNIGSEKRTKYGAVGAEINMAGRIESYTVGGQVLASEFTFSKVKHLVQLRSAIRVEMKGVKGTVSLYDLAGPSDATVAGYGFADDPLPIDMPLVVTVHDVSGKVVSSDETVGRITHLSRSSAIVQVEGRLSEMQDIRLNMSRWETGDIAGEVFAKVISVQSSGDKTEATVKFTFVPPEIRHYLRGIRTVSQAEAAEASES